NGKTGYCKHKTYHRHFFTLTVSANTMLPETRKKLYLYGLIAAASAGALFVLFAVFLNRGKLTVVTKAPFIIQVKDIKSENCDKDECTVELAPGDYTVTIQKAGYQSQELKVNVPIGGEHKEELEMRFLPVITLLGDEAGLKMFEEPKVVSESLPDVPLFFEKTYVVYLAPHPETKKQTLYVVGNQDGRLGDATAVTTFPRTIKNYVIIPGIEKNNLIAVIEQTDEESTLYMVNLEDKTRESLLTYPLITGVAWLPGTKDFLFESRDTGDISETVFMYRAEKKEVGKMDLKTSLSNIVPLSATRLLAATNQAILGTDNVLSVEGQLVALGEVEATPSILSGIGAAIVTGAPPTLNFVDYSLVANQARLIKTEGRFGIPEKMKLGSDGKTVVILSKGQVYELKFEE
ncbi:MAG TPA: hypothetical protein VI588_02805, partial [Candidatus Gracilibacteria bacterium]|nr:hypothetical protein [Candidatus Gracilibacteria bacterium]